MKIKKTKISIISLAVVSSLALNIAAKPVFAEEKSSVSGVKQSQSNPSYIKNENVYAKLRGDGSIGDVQVVNVFDIKEPSTITDYGVYDKIENLSNLDEIAYSNEILSFQGKENKFYYQGVLDSELPWNINIEYFLNGEKISSEDLGGRSGDLKIRIKTSKNSKVNSIFYENYLMQISLALDSQKCTNINAKGATVAEAGESQNITYAVLPGTDADYTIEAKVKGFSMKGITMAAVPYSMDISSEDFKIDEITSEMDKMTDAVKQLNEGAQQLNDGMKELTNGGNGLNDGIAQLEGGLQQLDSNGELLAGASSKINEALNTISSQLAAGDIQGISELKSLPLVLDELAGALGHVQEGITELYNGFIMSYGILDETIKGSVNALTDEEVGALRGAMANASGDAVSLSMYQKLMKSYEDVQRIQGVYEGIRPMFEALDNALNPTPAAGMENTSLVYGIGQVRGGLQQMSKELSASLNEVDIEETMKTLQQGLGTLASSYNEFNGGLVQYTKGVKAVKEGCGELSKGVNIYTDGVKQAGEGTTALAEGTEEFEQGTSTMPKTMQDTIDEMIKKYRGEDFEAVSFVDARNTNIGSVQFIMSTEEIAAPVVEVVEKVEVKEGFWDRLLSLFKK